MPTLVFLIPFCPLKILSLDPARSVLLTLELSGRRREAHSEFAAIPAVRLSD